MPKAPLIFDCALQTREAEHAFASLTSAQRAVLGCFACQSVRVQQGKIPGIEHASASTCTGESMRKVIDVSQRLEELGIVEREGGFSGGTRRLMMTPTDLGRRIFALSTTPDTCQVDIQAVPGLKVEKAVMKCIGCIWTKQIAKEERPAASTSMVAHCSGLSAKIIQAAVKKLVEDGKLRRTMAPNNVLLNKRLPTATYSPVGLQEALPRVSSKCALPIYSDVPQRYVQPLSSDYFASPPRESSQELYSDPAFLNKLHHDLLSADQEVALARIIQESTDPEEVKAAMETFVAHNFKLAVWGVQRAKADRLFLPYEDAISIAQNALVVAAEHFSPDRGVRFSTYAAYWLKQHLQRETAASIGVPVHDYMYFAPIYYMSHNFRLRYGRTPSIIEIAHSLQIRPRQVDRILQRRQHVIQMRTESLDNYINGEEKEDSEHQRVGTDDRGYMHVDLSASLERLRQYLAPAERDMLTNIIHDLGATARSITNKHGYVQANGPRMRENVASLARHPFFGLLAAVDESFGWQEDAACSTLKYDAVVSRARIVTNKTKKICQQCPVNQACETYAETAVPQVTIGVWNGRSAVSIARETAS